MSLMNFLDCLEWRACSGYHKEKEKEEIKEFLESKVTMFPMNLLERIWSRERRDFRYFLKYDGDDIVYFPN